MFGRRSTPTRVLTDKEEALSKAILTALSEIIEEVVGLEPRESMNPDANFRDDLDVDSLSAVEIAVQVEDEYGFQVPDEELASLTTIDKARWFVLDQIRDNPQAACAVVDRYGHKRQRVDLANLVREYAQSFI
jgi:acyl carrier protein